MTAGINGDGGTTAYAYDTADQLTKMTDPDSNVTSYTLDNDGYQTLVTDPNGYTTQQKFDGDGRVTQQITPDGAEIPRPEPVGRAARMHILPSPLPCRRAARTGFGSILGSYFSNLLGLPRRLGEIYLTQRQKESEVDAPGETHG